MSSSIVLGPLLGYELGDFYTVCILTDATVSDPKLTLTVGQKKKTVPFKQKAVVGGNIFWRAEFKTSVGPTGVFQDYAIKHEAAPLADQHGRQAWRFYVPGRTEEPRIAYISCNGFSSAKLARDTDEPYALWQRMQEEQQKSRPNTQPPPLSLMLFGGDQIYADEIWESRRCPTLQHWSEMTWAAQNKANETVQMRKEVAAFYDWVYLDRWKDEHLSLMLATVPSVMMWDDHDIFDGWGSYPEERQKCDVFKCVFVEAARVFDIFQMRCSARSRLNPQTHRTFHLLFRDYHILALDNRSERTGKQIMSEPHWVEFKACLAEIGKEPPKNLIILSGMPVVYRSFATVEKLFETTPWHEELEDDVQDQWSATSHQAERIRLIMVLLNFLAEHPKVRCAILSGDVHVGALGRIWDEERELAITQIISSGIVHPPPTVLGWMGIRLMTSDDPESLGEGAVKAQMLTPTGSDRYLRIRNFVSFFTGTDGKLWFNWACEDADLKPSFAASR